MARFLAVAVLLVACSHSSNVTIQGEVRAPGATSDLPITQGDCSAETNPMAGKQVVIQDGAGNIIGTATTKSTDATFVDKGLGITICHFDASFSLSVPKADFYKAVIEAPAGEQSSDVVSYADLASGGFKMTVVYNSVH